MRQICEGVDYMHKKFIMHLDMKPENILCVTRTGNRIKLIDFGLARRFDPSKKLQVMFGTPDFASPEVLSYDRVTPAADMWSVGVICYVLLSGLSPFMGNTDLETMTNVTKAIYDFDDDSFDPISDEAKDFISKLLVKDPNRRLKPSECLQHKWLAKATAKPATKLSKTKLKKYVVRRRWQKAVTAIMALTRMGANLSPASKMISSTGSPRGGVGGRGSTLSIGSRSSQPTSKVISSSSSSSSKTFSTSSFSRTKPPTAITPTAARGQSNFSSSYSAAKSTSSSSSSYRISSSSSSSTSRRY